MIQPKETRHNGYRFRSRLEARWAVFFKKLAIEYRYEPEGFNLNGMSYLPDFWLPEWECYVEIKPTLPTKIEWEKAIRLCIAKQTDLIMLAGEVGNDVQSWLLFFEEGENVRKKVGNFGLDNVHWFSEDEVIVHLKAATYNIFMKFDLGRNFGVMEGFFAYCIQCKRPVFVPGVSFCESDHIKYLDHPIILDAYTAARSARFEFGESG